MNKQMKIFMGILIAAVAALIIYAIYKYYSRQTSAAKTTETTPGGTTTGAGTTGSSGTGASGGIAGGLGGTSPSTGTVTNDAFPLKTGSSGPKVLIVQKVANNAIASGAIAGAIPLKLDGSYGTKTKDLVNKWKTYIGFIPDGQITYDEYNTYILPAYIGTIVG